MVSNLVTEMQTNKNESMDSWVQHFEILCCVTKLLRDKV